MTTCAIVSTTAAIVFFVKWGFEGLVSFDRYHRPPTWIFFACATAAFGIAANLGWWGNRLLARRSQPRLQPKHWFAAIGMVLLLAVASAIAYQTARFVPQARNDLDEYRKYLILSQRRSIREWAELVSAKSAPFRRVCAQYLRNQPQSPKDADALLALTKLLADDEAYVREAATATIDSIIGSMNVAGGSSTRFPFEHPEVIVRLIGALDSDDRNVRWYAAQALIYPIFADPAIYTALPNSVVPVLAAAAARGDLDSQPTAVTILGHLGPAASEAVPTLVSLIGTSNAEGSLRAIRVIGQIGPSARAAVPKLVDIILTSPDPAWRSAAARTLGALGPSAKPALSAFQKASKENLLTPEDAQNAYLIDPTAAEVLHIPKLGTDAS